MKTEMARKILTQQIFTAKKLTQRKKESIDLITHFAVSLGEVMIENSNNDLFTQNALLLLKKSCDYAYQSVIIKGPVEDSEAKHELLTKTFQNLKKAEQVIEKVRAESKEVRNYVRKNKDRFKSIHCQECFGYEYSYNTHSCKGHDSDGCLVRTCTLEVCLLNRQQEQGLNKPPLPKPPPDRVLSEDGKQINKEKK